MTGTGTGIGTGGGGGPRGLDLPWLRAALEAESDPGRAETMAAYLRNRFTLLGVRTPELRRAAKPILAAGRSATGDEVLDFAHRCWEQPEREFQYVGALLLRRSADRLEAHDLDRIRQLITTKAWWDTVDSLAAWTVGPLVATHDLGAEMDRWIDDTDIWVARSAILHQLSYKGDTDGDRLFRYALARSDDTEFFIRKALGWALRQYGRTEPDRVRGFVEANRDRLSGLTVREALKHLDR